MATIASKVVKHRGCYFEPQTTDAVLTFARSHWKLWSKKEGTIAVAHNDSNEAYTTMCWGPPVAGNEGTTGSQYFALGCASGRVQIWDPRSSELIGPVAEAFHAVVRGTDCAVAVIVASQPDRAAIFAGCYATPDILEIGVLDGVTRMSFKASKVNIVQLAASKSGVEWLISAGTGAALKLWRLPDKGTGVMPQTHARLVGPTNTSTCLDIWCSGDSVLALCADDSMQVDVFSCIGSETNHGSKLTAAVVLSSHERIRTAHFVNPLVGSTNTELAAVGFGLSIVAYWNFATQQFSASLKTPKTVAPSFIVQAEELGGRVLCAHIAISTAILSVASGAAAQPTFAEVRTPKTKGGSAIIEPCSASVAVKSADTKSKTAQEKKAALKTSADPTVLGPLDAVTTRCRAQRKGRALEEVEPPVKRQRLLEGSDVREPSGLSLAPIVRQALRSKDRSSIEQVLQNSDRRVICNTVADLSGAEAFDILQECTSRLMSQPIRGQVFCTWIQRVLYSHFAFIGSQPVLKNALQPMQDAFQVRCASYPILSKLRGRLHMLRNLGNHGVEQPLEEIDTVQTALLHYVEGDEDVDEFSGKETSSDIAGTDLSEDGVDCDENSDDALGDEWSDLEGD